MFERSQMTSCMLRILRYVLNGMTDDGDDCSHAHVETSRSCQSCCAIVYIKQLILKLQSRNGLAPCIPQFARPSHFCRVRTATPASRHSGVGTRPHSPSCARTHRSVLAITSMSAVRRCSLAGFMEGPRFQAYFGRSILGGE